MGIDNAACSTLYTLTHSRTLTHTPASQMWCVSVWVSQQLHTYIQMYVCVFALFTVCFICSDFSWRLRRTSFCLLILIKKRKTIVKSLSYELRWDDECAPRMCVCVLWVSHASQRKDAHTHTRTPCTVAVPAENMNRITESERERAHESHRGALLGEEENGTSSANLPRSSCAEAD